MANPERSRSSGSGMLVTKAQGGAVRPSLGAQRNPVAFERSTSPKPVAARTVMVGTRGLANSAGVSTPPPASPPVSSPLSSSDVDGRGPMALFGVARLNKPSPTNSPPPSPKQKQEKQELPALNIQAAVAAQGQPPPSPRAGEISPSKSNASPRGLAASQPVGVRPPSPRGAPKQITIHAMVVPSPPPTAGISLVDSSGLPVHPLSQSTPVVGNGEMVVVDSITESHSSSSRSSNSSRKSPTQPSHQKASGIEQLRELLLEPQLRVVSALVDVLDSSDKDIALQEELNEVALTLVHFFQGHNTIMRLLRHIIVKEISNTLDHTTLFRSNSLSTKMMTAYSKSIGAKYMKILKAPLEAVLKSDVAQLELDPLRLKPGYTVEGNWPHLEHHLTSFLTVIESSLSQVPAGFVEVCSILSQETAKRFPDSRLTSVGGFVFLRFFCPAIVSPDSHDLAATSDLTPESRRALILLSKILQNLANGVKKISGKEAFMQVAEGFLDTHIPTVFAWFESLVSRARPSNRGEVDEPGHQKDGALFFLQPLLSRNIHKIGRQLLSNDKRQSVASFATSAHKKGYLFKKGESKSTAWRKRWCILKEDFLYYFRTPNDTNPAGVVPLSGSTVHASAPHDPTDQYVFEIVSSHRVYWLKAKTEEELNDWVRHISKLIDQKRVSVRNDWKPANTNAGQALLERRGWVVKRGDKIKTWKKRWCIIKDQYLLYFKSPDEAVPQGEINLGDCQVRAADAKAVDPPGICFLIETKDRTWWMLAQDSDDMNMWMEAVRQAKARYWQRTEEIGQEVAVASSSSNEPMPRDQVDRLIAKLKDPSTGLPLKDRTVYLKHYPGCFQGNHMVDWLGKNMGIARKAAVKLGQQLLKDGEIHHIEHALQFMDGPKFYQFKSADSIVNSKKEGVLWRASKDRKKWKRWWVVLKGSYVYFFRNSQKNVENDKKSKNRVLPLQGTTIYLSEREGDKGFCFDIVTRQRIYFMKTEDENDMRMWVQLFTEARDVISTDENTAQSLQKRGWMSKQGGKMRVWQKRMFHLRGNMLYYYKNPQDLDPAGVIPLANCTVEAQKIESRSFVFQVGTRYRNYFLSVETQQDYDDWREIIGNAKQLSDEASVTEDMKLFLQLTQALATFELAKS